MTKIEALELIRNGNIEEATKLKEQEDAIEDNITIIEAKRLLYKDCQNSRYRKFYEEQLNDLFDKQSKLIDESSDISEIISRLEMETKIIDQVIENLKME
jgi:hypothetical protein